jgi:hypothetical protein
MSITLVSLCNVFVVLSTNSCEWIIILFIPGWYVELEGRHSSLIYLEASRPRRWSFHSFCSVLQSTEKEFHFNEAKLLCDGSFFFSFCTVFHGGLHFADKFFIIQISIHPFKLSMVYYGFVFTTFI